MCGVSEGFYPQRRAISSRAASRKWGMERVEAELWTLPASEPRLVTVALSEKEGWCWTLLLLRFGLLLLLLLLFFLLIFFTFDHLLETEKCFFNGGYAQQTSVKQVTSLPVQVFCMCFVKYGPVLLKMPSKEIPFITSPVLMSRLFLTMILILKLNKTATKYIILHILSCNETWFLVWSDDVAHCLNSCYTGSAERVQQCFTRIITVYNMSLRV